MAKLEKLIAEHPLREPPYSFIAYSRIDGQGTPLYRVGSAPKEMGAAEALKLAFRENGGRCFHCKTELRPQKLSHQCTRDHVRPRCEGGPDRLYNLVISCGPCNREKAGKDVIAFRAESASAYLKALEEHLGRCVAALAKGD
jgi:hypothetical protein